MAVGGSSYECSTFNAHFPCNLRPIQYPIHWILTLLDEVCMQMGRSPFAHLAINKSSITGRKVENIEKNIDGKYTYSNCYRKKPF